MSNTPLGILLVQDSPQVAQRLQAMLANAGSAEFEVTAVHRLKEALAIIASQRFQAIVLDPALPDSEGLEAIQRINSVTGVPIVVVSELADDAMALAAVRAGAQDCLAGEPLPASRRPSGPPRCPDNCWRSAAGRRSARRWSTLTI